MGQGVESQAALPPGGIISEADSGPRMGELVRRGEQPQQSHVLDCCFDVHIRSFLLG